jgi:hypothetical protein
MVHDGARLKGGDPMKSLQLLIYAMLVSGLMSVSASANTLDDLGERADGKCDQSTSTDGASYEVVFKKGTATVFRNSVKQVTLPFAGTELFSLHAPCQHWWTFELSWDQEDQAAQKEGFYSFMLYGLENTSCNVHARMTYCKTTPDDPNFLCSIRQDIDLHHCSLQ